MPYKWKQERVPFTTKAAKNRAYNKAMELKGTRYENADGLWLTIIYYHTGRQVDVQFDLSKSIRTVTLNNILNKKVKDMYLRTVFGIGYLGHYDKDLPYERKAKQLWQNVMKRCYSETDDKGYKGKVIVDERWHAYENFLIDIASLEGFNEWLNGTSYELDKDKIGDGTVYSRQTCSFIHQRENRQLQENYRVNKAFNVETRTWE